MMDLEALASIETEELELLLVDAPDDAAREMIAEEIKRREDERIAQLILLVKRKEEQRDKNVKAKRGIERRVAEDLALKHGVIEGQRADRLGYPTSRGASTPPGLNLTKNRCELWSARVNNMTVPGNQIPVQIQSTPDPEVIDPRTGQPLPPDQAKPIAEAAASAMNTVIKDQFAECHLAADMRLGGQDFIDTGTAIFTGPENFRRKRKKFKRVASGKYVGHEMVADGQIAPTWRRVDFRYFFPEMVGSIKVAQYTDEVIPMTRAQLIQLSKEPGFDKFEQQFRELLERDTDPDLGEWGANVTQWNSMSPTKEEVVGRFAVWRHVGVLDKKDVEICGCETDGEGDVLVTQPMVEIWYCEGLPLKAEPYVLDGDRLPYYVVAFDKLDDTMFGGSLPFRARDAQDSITALWMSIQHNTAVSAGPVNFWHKGKIEAPDNNPAILGPKNFDIVDTDVQDVRQIVLNLIFPNVTDKMLEVLRFRIEMFDEEIGLPAIAQGKPAEAVQTASEMLMLNDSANVTQKDMAQRWEDDILTPIAESAYHWNMLHNEREDIKQDADCVASLMSDNLFRDIKAQRLLMLKRMAAEDPKFGSRLKEERWDEIMAQCMEIESDLFRTDEEVAQKQQQDAANQPQDPAMVELELRRQKNEADAEFQNKDRDLDRAEHEEEMRIRELEANTRRFEAESNVRIAAMRMDQDADKAVVDAQLKASTAAEKERTARMGIGAQAGAKAQEIAHQERKVEREIQAESQREPGPIL